MPPRCLRKRWHFIPLPLRYDTIESIEVMSHHSLTCSVHLRNFPPSSRSLWTSICAGSNVVTGVADAIFLSLQILFQVRLICDHFEIHNSLYQSITQSSLLAAAFFCCARAGTRCLTKPYLRLYVAERQLRPGCARAGRAGTAFV